MVPPYARQVRLQGPIDVQMGSELARLDKRVLKVELRDVHGTPYQHSVARMAWAETSTPDWPDLIVEVDICLSVAPPEADLEAQRERMEIAFARAREYEPHHQGKKGKIGRRLSRDQTLARDRLVVEESREMSAREIGLRHGIHHNTVHKILKRARDAGEA